MSKADRRSTNSPSFAQILEDMPKKCTTASAINDEMSPPPNDMLRALLLDGRANLDEAVRLLECALMATKTLVRETGVTRNDEIEAVIAPIKQVFECAHDRLIYTRRQLDKVGAESKPV